MFLLDSVTFVKLFVNRSLIFYLLLNLLLGVSFHSKLLFRQLQLLIVVLQHAHLSVNLQLLTHTLDLHLQYLDMLFPQTKSLHCVSK